jgi:hypothetical protein
MNIVAPNDSRSVSSTATDGANSSRSRYEDVALLVNAGGDVRCINDEALDLRERRKLQITRASHVEPDRDGFWWADMAPVDGPVLGPFRNRTEALEAERGWLAAANHDLIGSNQWRAATGLSTPHGFIPSSLDRVVLH